MTGKGPKRILDGLLLAGLFFGGFFAFLFGAEFPDHADPPP
jgi:hypothetical protein